MIIRSSHIFVLFNSFSNLIKVRQNYIHGIIRVNPLCHNYVYKYVLYNSMLNLIQPCDREINGQSNKMSSSHDSRKSISQNHLSSFVSARILIEYYVRMIKEFIHRNSKKKHCNLSLKKRQTFF